MGIAESLKALYDSVEEAYYSFAEGLQQKGVPFMDYFVTPIETRGIPSLPVFVLIFVALAAAALLVLTSSGGLGTRTLSVSVSSGGLVVDGASVQVLFQDGVVAKGLTQDGKIVFNSLPAALVTVRVSKAAFKTVTQRVPQSKASVAITLSSTPLGTENSPDNATGGLDNATLTVLVVDARDQSAIAGASVLYVSDAQNSGQLSTDAQGMASLPSSSLVNLRVSKAGYHTETLSVQGGGSTTVYLKSLHGSIFDLGGTGGDNGALGQSGSLGQNSTSLSSSGSVSVVMNSSVGPVDGHVRLFVSDGTLLGESDTVAGLARFSAPLGASVFVTAQTASFGLYDGSGHPQNVTDNTQFVITLDSGSNGTSSCVASVSTVCASNASELMTIIRAVDKQGNNLTFAAHVFALPMVELGQYQGDLWQQGVLPGHYYVTVKSDGYLEQTADLQVGKENVFTLVKATPFNSAALSVGVLDEYSNPVVGANVMVSQSGRPVAPAQVSDAQGQVSFTELALSSFDVSASFGGQNATARVQVQQGGSKTLVTLNIHHAVLVVNATNAADGSPVAGAHFSLTSGDAAPVLLSGASASFKAPSKLLSQLFVNADGFMAYSTPLVLNDGETRKVNAVLIPQNATSGASVHLVQIRKVDGTAVSQMQVGGTYVVDLNATPSGSAQNQTVYFRIGTQSSVDADVAYITEYSDADAVLKSTSYQPSPDCSDLASNLASSPDGYKWVQLQFKQPATRQHVMFAVQVRAGAASNQKLPLFYATGTQSGAVSSRDPADDRGAVCHPRPYEYDVPLVASGSGGGSNGSNGNNDHGNGIVTPTPGPSYNESGNLTFTPFVGITYNAATGKVEANVKEIDLQVDAIYPRDSVPLQMDESFTTIEPSVQSLQGDCYQVSHTSLTFVTKDYASACKSKVVGNSVVLADDAPYLVLNAIKGGPTSTVKIPIRITVAPASAIQSAPQTLDGGEQTAKLAYVMNQIQPSARTLTAVGGQGSIAVDRHSATAFSWSGPGSLSLLDADQTVGSWTYQSATAYFSGIGTVGTRTDSASDYLSCAQGWCSGNALAQALRFFQNQAQLVATQTQFRRAGITVTPLATIAPSPTPIPTANPTSSVDAKLTVNVMDSLSRPIPGIDVEVSPGLGQAYGGTTDSNGVSTVSVPSQQALYLFLNRDLTQVANYTLDPIPSQGQKTISVVLTSSGSVTVSPSPTVTVTPSPTPSGSATPTPTANPSATTVTMKVGVLVSAGNFKLNLTDVFAGSSPSAGIDVINSAGVVIDSPTKQKGDAYTGNGFSFTVTSVVYDTDPSKASVQIQLSNSVQSAPFVPVQLESQTILFSRLYFDSGATASDAFVFSTVMQVTESADKAFDAFGFSRTGTQCNGLPGVYLVQATTTDGKNFQYSAQAMTLSQSPDGKPPGTLLCGFIYAQKKNIVAAKLATLASIHQANEQHSKAETKLAIYTMAPIMAQTCTAKGVKIVALEKEIAALKADLTQAAKLIQEAIAQAKSGVSIAFASEASSKAAGSACQSNAATPPYVCVYAVCTPYSEIGQGIYTGAFGLNTQASVAEGQARLSLFNSQNALSNALSQATIPPSDATAQSSVSSSTPSTGSAVATEAVTKASGSLTTAVSAITAAKGTALTASKAALVKPPTDVLASTAMSTATSSTQPATTAATKAANALSLSQSALQVVTKTRQTYDAKVKELKATKQSCDQTKSLLFEIPAGLIPQFSQLQCISDDNYAKKAADLAQQLADYQKMAKDSRFSGLFEEVSGGFDDSAGLKKLSDLKAQAAKGCVARCAPKPACVESFPQGNQFVQTIHLGLSADCTPYSSNIGMDLAKSMVANSLMKSLSSTGPYGNLAMMYSISQSGGMGGFGCNGAQGYFTTGNLNGAGAQVSGGLIGQNA